MNNLEMRLNPITIEIVICLHVMISDYDKIYKWLITKNEKLNGQSPLYLINTGRAKVVADHVEAWITER